jgi:hypothetical protein
VVLSVLRMVVALMVVSFAVVEKSALRSRPDA